MSEYKVRGGFTVEFNSEIYEAGEVLDLSPEEFEQVKHMVEPAEKPQELKKGGDK